MWPGDIVNALAAACPRETIVTTDVGSHKYLFGQFWPSGDAETFWMSNGLSGMAYGLGLEFYQQLLPFDRTFDWWDAAADAVGVLLGSLVVGDLRDRANRADAQTE